MNEVFYDNPEYYLSYLKYPSDLTRAMDNFLGVKDENVGRSETAVCSRDPWRCLILYGDHREQMKPIAHDLKALEKYWSETPDKGNTSDDLAGEWLKETA